MLTRKRTEIAQANVAIRFPLFLGYFVNDDPELMVSVSVIADTSSITVNLIFVDASFSWIGGCRFHCSLRRCLIHSIRCGTS